MLKSYNFKHFKRMVFVVNWLYMNKEVIYLEAEDDITDILTKLQQAEQKLVALVPPKKSTMLRSSVNMKLVARVAKECDKIIVIVTQDPAIVKMAMSARIPVAKTLQSRPVIPTEANVRAAEAAAENSTVDEIDETELKSRKSRAKTETIPAEGQEIELGGVALGAEAAKDASKMPLGGSDLASDERPEQSADTIDLSDDDLEKAAEKRHKGQKTDLKSRLTGKKSSKTPSQANNFFEKYRKWIMIGAPIGLGLILLLVWAFVFAPSATITVAVSSTPENFSENVTFTTDPNAESIEEGRFYVEQQTLEQKYSGEFESNTKENKGEKAGGAVTVSTTFVPVDKATKAVHEPFSIDVHEGDVFTTDSGLRFVATVSNSATWNGSDLPAGCSSLNGSCRLAVNIAVEAEKGGEDYNISASETWHTFQGLYTVSNALGFSGGTTKMERVVGQDEVDKFAETQLADHTTDGREMVFADVPKDMIAIESSFKAEVTDKSSTPAVGDAIGENTKPKADIKVTYSVYMVERSKVEEYIKQQLHLGDDRKVYAYDEVYFERFTSIEEPARLKSVVAIGPVVTEDLIFEKAKGRKTGEVQSELRLITGVSSAEVRTPFFWVNKIPSDRSKVTVILEGED